MRARASSIACIASGVMVPRRSNRRVRATARTLRQTATLSTGYGNTITDHACNNANVKLSAYGIAFNGAGHCATLAISSYDNKVTVDSVDTIAVSGYNNTVSYHSGAPKITNSGYDNNIRQG